MDKRGFTQRAQREGVKLENREGQTQRERWQRRGQGERRGEGDRTGRRGESWGRATAQNCRKKDGEMMKEGDQKHRDKRIKTT